MIFNVKHVTHPWSICIFFLRLSFYITTSPHGILILVSFTPPLSFLSCLWLNLCCFFISICNLCASISSCLDVSGVRPVRLLILRHLLVVSIALIVCLCNCSSVCSALSIYSAISFRPSLFGLEYSLLNCLGCYYLSCHRSVSCNFVSSGLLLSVNSSSVHG